MKSKRIGVLAFGMILSAGMAQAQLVGNLLLRDSAFTNAGFVNQVFGDFPTYSTGMGSMVSTSEGWNVSDIQVLQIGSSTVGNVNTWYGNVNSAVLNVTRQVAGAPDASVDPTVGTNAGANVVYSGVVSVVLDNGTANVNGDNQSFRMVADTSGIAELQGLAAGDYVFSLAGMADFGLYGQTFTGEATATGSGDYVRNPGGSFALPIGTGWGKVETAFGRPAGSQWGIGINGSVVPEPASLAVLGLGALVLLRRKR